MKRAGKKLLLIVLIFALVMTFPSCILASEAAYNMVFGNTQRALLVGVVLDVDKDTDQLTCEVIRVVSGSYNQSLVTIDRNQRYLSADHEYVYFQLGDGVLLSR